MARRYQELALGPNANGWVIHWEPGHDTGWHDHGGSSVTIVVASGVLREEVRPVTLQANERLHAPGDVVTIPPTYQHRVVPHVPCTAIHIYTPRLETMNLFDEDGTFTGTQNASEELDDAEPIKGWDALLPRVTYAQTREVPPPGVSDQANHGFKPRSKLMLLDNLDLAAVTSWVSASREGDEGIAHNQLEHELADELKHRGLETPWWAKQAS